jgi:hypothetical protein
MPGSLTDPASHGRGIRSSGQLTTTNRFAQARHGLRARGGACARCLVETRCYPSSPPGAFLLETADLRFARGCERLRGRPNSLLLGTSGERLA